MSNMLDRIRNRRVQEEKVIPLVAPLEEARASKSLVYDVVGTREDKKLKKRGRASISLAETASSFEQAHVVFNEWAGPSIEIKDFFAVPEFKKTTKESFSRWDTNLWIEECTPPDYESLLAFADEASGEMGDRGKTSANFRQVLRAVQNTIDEKKQKLHVLVGETCGKSMILRLIAKYYKFELISVQEDDNVEEFLKNASAVGLDDTRRLWVLEHLDLLNFDKIIEIVPRLLKTGPVFATSWPEAEFLLSKDILISQVFSWSDEYKLKYLKKFGPLIEIEPFFKDDGTISGALNNAQLGSSRDNLLSLCGQDCKGQCTACLQKRRIPSNWRLLVEDTVCNRSTLAKCNLLSGDVDTSICLLQEMAPMVSSDIESVCKAYEAFSFLDLVGYSTVIKDAFLDDGLLQSEFRTKRNFDSGTLIPVPSMFWKTNRKRPDIRSLLQKCRGIKKKKKEEEEDEEYMLDDPYVDFRDLDEDLPLFAQARGLKDTWKDRLQLMQEIEVKTRLKKK